MLVTPDVLASSSARLPEDIDPQETADWLEAMEAVLKHGGPERAKFLLETLIAITDRAGAKMLGGVTTPYVNTIPVEDQAAFPGDRTIERKLKSIIRWNAMAMVLKANKTTNVGGHISTYASAATLYEIGFNHFFHGRSADHPGDVVFFQGHASPGMYARAFVEGRLDETKVENFRQELKPGGGLSSYPHPWLMPDFWQYPTVSMGLGPIMSIYHARYNRYLRDRDLARTDRARVWAFLGDGECDEPESLGAISFAGREKLDNLTWVINCNLQRLDGPVRGNGKIIQELEGVFRGAGWNVIKVVWGTGWDELLKNDHTGALARRMMEVVDGEYCDYVGRDMRTPDELKTGKLISEEEDADRRGAYIRDVFFNTPELKALVEHLSNRQISALKRGGHDPLKVYAGYKAATEYKGQPTVILVKTVKGYGIPGEGGQGKFTTHQLKKLAVQIEAVPNIKPEEKSKRQMLAALRQFRERFRASAHRRRGVGTHPAVPPAGRRAGDAIPEGPPRCARRPAAVPQQRLRAVQAAGAEELRAAVRGHRRGEAGFDHLRVGQPDDAVVPRPERRQAARPHRAGRRADVRNAADVQDVRHVFQRRADVHAGRQGVAVGVPRVEDRADSARRN